MKRNLNDYQAQFDSLPFERTLEIYRKKRLLELVHRDIKASQSLLEVGPGLNPIFPSLKEIKSVVVLEPLVSIHEQLLDRFKQTEHLEISTLLLEDYVKANQSRKFDLVILSSVLHELPNPTDMLIEIRKILNKDGVLLVVVPNNLSIHRLIGYDKGLIKSLTELTTTEIMMQQFASYSPQTLKQLLTSTGFKSVEVITSFIKLLPHSEMQEAIDTERIKNEDLDFLYNISDLLRDYGSEIFGLARK